MPKGLYFTDVVFSLSFLLFTGWGGKNRFWTNPNMISTIGSNLSIYRDSLHAANLANIGPETGENGWRVFAHPLNIRTGRHCQPYRMDDNRQQANFGTVTV